LRESPRGFLRQIVPDTAPDELVRIFPREFLRIRIGVQVRCAIGITFKGDGGYGDYRTCGKLLFQIVIFSLASGQSKPPAVIMDNDSDMVRDRCPEGNHQLVIPEINNLTMQNQSEKVKRSAGEYMLTALSRQPDLNDPIKKLTAPAGKKSFLVFKQNKYLIVPTESIALFYIKYESSVIGCFDGQEYFVNYSLEQIQHLLTELQFFRLNRQYLINFDAVKEVEHYFARKLSVKLSVPVPDKLLVSKEKVSVFLQWLENR
jgi:hypothetical protein